MSEDPHRELRGGPWYGEVWWLCECYPMRCQIDNGTGLRVTE